MVQRVSNSGNTRSVSDSAVMDSAVSGLAVSDSVVTYAVGSHLASSRPTRKPSTSPDEKAPEGSSPLGSLVRFGGPYTLPVSELAVGAWFAVTQARHVIDVVSPGPAQLWRAGGHGGVVWHALAALVGAGAAVHGLLTLMKLWGKK